MDSHQRILKGLDHAFGDQESEVKKFLWVCLVAGPVPEFLSEMLLSISIIYTCKLLTSATCLYLVNHTNKSMLKTTKSSWQPSSAGWQCD